MLLRYATAVNVYTCKHSNVKALQKSSPVLTRPGKGCRSFRVGLRKQNLEKSGAFRLKVIFFIISTHHPTFLRRDECSVVTDPPRACAQKSLHSILLARLCQSISQHVIRIAPQKVGALRFQMLAEGQKFKARVLVLLTSHKHTLGQCVKHGLRIHHE